MDIPFPTLTPAVLLRRKDRFLADVQLSTGEVANICIDSKMDGFDDKAFCFCWESLKRKIQLYRSGYNPV